ncbi:hypothetical protein ACFQ0X_15385 [Streptomyces rectiviolaceus]|uniref:Tat pathway signal sequence domain protein n=1 Tax=Streptomyces rectiviolaceus TaxID=332591 RepID=A0ABP6NLA0_9ACTN
MSTRRRRSLLRTAAVTTAAGSALLLPAVAAVAESPGHAGGARTVAAGSPAHSEGKRTVAPVAPEGGVKAGTEGFHSGDPIFIAVGGAMAAAGAAGLGYAMLRRGRTDA